MFPPSFSTSPQLFSRYRAALNFLTAHGGLLICALFLLTGLATAGDYGIGRDEFSQRRIAKANLNYILGVAERDGLFLSDQLYGIAFELPLLLVEQSLGQADYYYIHRLRLTLTHLFFIVGAFFCYRLAYRLFDNRLLALFALLIFLLHPRIYAHSFVNSKDLPFLSMLIIALYLLERAFRRDTIGAFVLLGIAVGLLTNLRIVGVMLLAAALAMRGLDLFYAGSGPERKHILLSGGLLILAAGLTWYIITPYAWANPVDYLAARLDQTVNHPNLVPALFQGAGFSADQLPPHYNAVWFAITTPPPLLLLGGLGAAAAVAQSLRRPGAALRPGRRRWQPLLLAVFLLPLLAAALLGPNQHQDWRHFYFLYVPFGLLATGGLGWLAAALARRRRWPAGAYGLTGLGLALILLQMTQIHPLQHLYFNFLVDRTTPEYLRTQYDLDYWNLALPTILAELLEGHPQETLALRVEHWNRLKALPPAAQRRLTVAGRRADYEARPPDPGQPDLAFHSLYRRQVYNNTLIVLRPPDAARMTATAIAAYGELYRQAVAGEPIIRSDYDVYRHGQRLTFVQENCPPEGPDAWLGWKLFPYGTAALPPPWREQPGAYAPFGNSSVRLGRRCLAVVQLPDSARGDLILMQRNLGHWGPEGLPLWEEFYSPAPPGLREHIARLRPEQPPAGPEAFEVFLEPAAGGGYRLLYAKKRCSPAEYETLVTLHIYPENLTDLPFYLWAGGFENREFPLPRHGGRPGGECLAAISLPDYPIAAIRTGQGNRWEKNLYPPADLKSLRAAYAALSAVPPDLRDAFDLYWQDGQLTYIRETCAAADTAEPFFLHIFPAAADVLAGPAAEQDNRDFAFARWGGSFDGKCLATVPLPDYPIAALRTGQTGRWEVNFYPPDDPEPLRAAYAALSQSPPVARSNFDLYMRDDRLVYLRETCAAADTAAGFFLHIVPADAADLTAERQAAGFAHRDFDFGRWGGFFDGQCLAAIILPDYPIKEIRTGQHIPGQGDLWSVELIAAPDYDQLRADYAALSAAKPAARDYFDLYWRDNRLLYLRESCAAADTAAGFFLHIVPVDVADLPEDRRPAGFAHGGFNFVRQGGHFDGKCLAAVALPDYPIKEMRTGQYVPGQGDLWSVVIAAP